MAGWTKTDWAQLRTLEGLGMVLLPLCSTAHPKAWPRCSKPGKTPIDLARGEVHAAGWAARAVHGGLDLEGFRRVQEARARMGRPPYGVGAATGRPLADGRRLVSFDVDGAEGVEDARRLLGANRTPTLTYRTGSGGWHLLYGVPGEGAVPERYADGGHQGVALQGVGRQTVLPPSGHISGTPYCWPRGGPCWEIADLPAVVREWAAETPVAAGAQAAAVPLVPARPAAEVDRDLRLHGVPESLRRSVAAPYQGGDRSGHVSRPPRPPGTGERCGWLPPPCTGRPQPSRLRRRRPRARAGAPRRCAGPGSSG